MSSGAPAAGVVITGSPTAREVAAVLAVLALLAVRQAPADPPPYEKWRSGRLTALRRTMHGGHR